MPPGNRFTDSLPTLERFACIAVILWLQLVGVMSNTVLHHVLHALPIAILSFVKPSRVLHLTAALAGFIWVLMPSAMTPMVCDSLVRGFFFNLDNHDMWLAPGLSLIAGLWLSLNHAKLCPRRAKWYILGGCLLTPALALLYPAVNFLFKIPLEHVIQGRISWAVLLVAEPAAVLLGRWVLFVKLTGSRYLKCGKKLFLWQVLFWLFFLACMGAWLLPYVNPGVSAPLTPVAEATAVLFECIIS